MKEQGSTIFFILFDEYPQNFLPPPKPGNDHEFTKKKSIDSEATQEMPNKFQKRLHTCLATEQRRRILLRKRIKVHKKYTRYRVKIPKTKHPKSPQKTNL